MRSVDRRGGFLGARREPELWRRLAELPDPAAREESFHYRIARIESVTGELTEERARAPSPREIAERSGIEIEEVLETLQAQRYGTPVALQAPIEEDDDRRSTLARRREAADARSLADAG